MTYSVFIDNVKSGKNIGILEWRDIPAFTKRQLDAIRFFMFMSACEGGIDSEMITATVYRAGVHDIYERDAEIPAFTMLCTTKQDGSDVWSDIYVNGTFVRQMIVAC